MRLGCKYRHDIRKNSGVYEKKTPLFSNIRKKNKFHSSCRWTNTCFCLRHTQGKTIQLSAQRTIWLELSKSSLGS